MKEVKLYNRKTKETEILNEQELGCTVDDAFIAMTIKIWVMHHNRINPSHRITRRDIMVLPD